MKKFKLQLEDVNGNVQEESELVLGESDTLIMQYPEDMTLEKAHQVYNAIRDGIGKGEVLGVPTSIQFKVIKAR